MVGTVTIGANFAGSDSNLSGFIPPDSDGAIGPSAFVEFLNGVYRVYSPGGVVLQQSSAIDFWSGAGQTPDATPIDPRVLYDPSSGRWFAAGITSTDFLLAVSNTSDPTQGWQALTIQAVPSASSKFLDFTMLGVNQQGVYLEASNDSYIVAIPKDDLLSSVITGENAKLFTSPGDPIASGEPGFAAQPAIAPDLAGSEPFISAANWDAGELRISSIDWTDSTPTLNAMPGRSVTVEPMAFPRDAPQLGSDALIDTVDPRLTDSAVLQNGDLFALQTVLGPDGRDVLRWYEIDDPLGTPQLIASGDISPPGLDAYFGSIAVNPSGGVVIGFSASSPSQYVGSYAVAGQVTEAGIQFDNPILLAAGTAPNTTGRWGDYSTTTFDPADPTKFWTIQELPTADNVWRTQITELDFQSATPPANRMWTGAVSSDARNPGNWSPTGAPRPGDNLTDSVDGSTIDIKDNALAGNQLSISARVTLNLSDHAKANLVLGPLPTNGPLPIPIVVANLTGNDTLEAVVGGGNPPGGIPGSLTVNLAEHAKLHGSFNVEQLADLTISGGQNTKYIHDATDTLLGARDVVDTKVTGSGTFVLNAAVVRVSRVASSLEFGGFVAKGQKIDISGGPRAGSGEDAVSRLQIDDPKQFHGAVVLHDFSLTDLVGLAAADSWSYRNDMLSIKNACGSVIDRLHIVSDASSTGSVHGLSVCRSAAGDVLISPGTSFHGLLSLPMT